MSIANDPTTWRGPDQRLREGEYSDSHEEARELFAEIIVPALDKAGIEDLPSIRPMRAFDGQWTLLCDLPIASLCAECGETAVVELCGMLERFVSHALDDVHARQAKREAEQMFGCEEPATRPA